MKLRDFFSELRRRRVFTVTGVSERHRSDIAAQLLLDGGHIGGDEFRREPGGPVLERYVNDGLLYWDGSRWWVHGAVWDTERPGKEIPDEWVGVRERVP